MVMASCYIKIEGDVAPPTPSLPPPKKKVNENIQKR